MTKISQGIKIFNEQLALRETGKFSSNREFRASVLSRMTTELGASVGSAATMYNTAKRAIESSNPNIGLGRDSKKQSVIA